jgi:hypothetical protein
MLAYVWGGLHRMALIYRKGCTGAMSNRLRAYVPELTTQVVAALN